MRFTFLGTGCPVPDAHRSGPAHMVEGGGARVLIDCGAGVARRLAVQGLHPGTLDALLITHYHSDHIADFVTLIVAAWHQGRDRPWIVHGPETALANLEAQWAAYADERALRVAHEKRPSTRGLEIDFRPLQPELPLQVGELRITPFLVDHAPVAPAYGFAFDAAARRIVFSGDTAPCEAVETMATDADLLVHEVFHHGAMPVVPGVRSAATIEAVAGYHTLPAPLGRLATAARARALALTHVVPPRVGRAELVGLVQQHFTGPVILGEDGMTIDVTTHQVIGENFALSYG